MPLLHVHHITDMYCLVDELVERRTYPTGGRPPKMTETEIVTILVWNVCVLKQKTLKDIHTTLSIYHTKDFLHIPKYSAFVDACHRAIPVLERVLQLLLHDTAEYRIVDSTMIPVCKIYRADRHKVAKDVAAYGKNHQGWHYGFKLHASVDFEGRLSQVYFTGANEYDGQTLPHILNSHANIAVGDGTYNASIMRRKIWKMYECHVVAPVHPKQVKSLMTQWQEKFLHMRPKIESVFDYLKEHLHLVTSFPRSIKGYHFHYLKVLVGYAFMRG